jgi:PmbA protein
MSKVFFVPGQTTIIDYAREIGPNMWAARCSWLMLPEIRVRHPSAVLDDQTAFLQAQESSNGTKPARITEARFDFAVSNGQVLDYFADETGDSFILQAPEVGDLVRVYARCFGHCWSFLCLPIITHSEIRSRICTAVATNH